jgi:hypothetical protein
MELLPSPKGRLSGTRKCLLPTPYPSLNLNKRQKPKSPQSPQLPKLPKSPFAIEPVFPEIPAPFPIKITHGFHFICQRCAGVINAADVGISVTPAQIKTGMDFFCNKRLPFPYPVKYTMPTPENNFLPDRVDIKTTFMTYEEDGCREEKGYTLLSNILNQNPEVEKFLQQDLYHITVFSQMSVTAGMKGSDIGMSLLEVEQGTSNGITFVIRDGDGKVCDCYRDRVS